MPFTYFGYGKLGHKVIDCPMKNAAPPVLTLTRYVSIQGMPCKNVAGAIHGCLTHLTMDDAWDTPDMVYDMFLVHGSKASILFDSSATCSYISTKFAREHNLPIIPQRVPINTSSPSGNIRCTKRCQGVNITIEGHPLSGRSYFAFL